MKISHKLLDIESDESWTEELEEHHSCSQRGYSGLLWMMQQQEKHMLLVCHGGLLNLTLNKNDNVVLLDKREVRSGSKKHHRCITKRFGNCEMREFIVTAWHSEDTIHTQQNGGRPVLTLEEVTKMEECL